MRISDLSSDVCSSDLMLSVVPGISAAMARSLLAAHGSLASVAAAAPEGLRHHPGIGRVRSTRLAEALHGEFVAPVDRDPEPARPSRTERAPRPWILPKSAERRVGKECVSPCRARGAPP